MPANIDSPAADGDHISGTAVTVVASVDPADGANGATLFVNDDGTFRSYQANLVNPVAMPEIPAGRVGWKFTYDSTKKAIDKTTDLPLGTTVKLRVSPRVPTGTTAIAGYVRTVVTEAVPPPPPPPDANAVVSPYEGDTVTGMINVSAHFTVAVDRVTLYTQEVSGGAYLAHPSVTISPPSKDVTVQWDSAAKADGTVMPDNQAVKLRVNGRDAALQSNVPNAPIVGVIAHNVPAPPPPPPGVIWDKKVDSDPTGVQITSLTNWLGSVFGAADVGPNSIDPAGTPAIQVRERTDPKVTVLGTPPAAVQRVIDIIAGKDPLRADARAEIADQYSGPTSPVPPYVDANGVSWYSPEWLSDRTNIDPRSALADGLEGMERWYYDSYAFDPARPPLPGYIIQDQHAKYGVNFLIGMGSTPGTLKITVRGGEFEAVPDDTRYSGMQPAYKPTWVTDTADPRYTGYSTTYMVAPSGGTYAARWYKNASGAFVPVDANVGSAQQYTRRPGEYPSYWYDFAAHQPVYLKGLPGNGVPQVIYYQGYQRTFDNLPGLRDGFNNIERHTIWSADKSKGGHQVWLNGNLILDLMGVPTLYKWTNNLVTWNADGSYAGGLADCHLGVASDQDGTQRSGYLATYRQIQNYAAGMKAPDGSDVPDPPCRMVVAPIMMSDKRQTPNW